MAAVLLPLSNGHYSLEFESSDFPQVAEAICRRYGTPDRRQYPASAEYRFGGCSFTFQNEWDDPCLISRSSEGDSILHALHDELEGTK